VYKTSEGCNFSRGFGYMGQGSERRDVTIGNPSASVRHLEWNPPVGYPPAPNTPETFAVYHIQHTVHILKTPTRKKDGIMRGYSVEKRSGHAGYNGTFIILNAT